MKVLFLSYIPSPYRVAFFNELGKQCELTVVFEKAVNAIRDDSWKDFSFDNFRGIVLDGIGDSNRLPRFSVTQYLKRGEYDAIVVHNPTTPTGIWAIRYMKQHHIPYLVESDGAFPRGEQNGGIAAHIKRYLYKDAALCLSTAELNDRYFTENGVAEDRILRYPFSSIAAADILPTPLSHEEKAAFKATLGIREEKAVVTVGSFIHRKGFDVLLKAAASLPENVGVYFIGGKPTDEYKELIERLKLNNIHFIDFQLKKDLWRYFQAADVFALPTREDIWGLVVNEAMANALPVVTTERCIAGLELVKQCENGYIVPINDADALAERINAIIENNEQQAAMAQKSLDVIRDYTIETMADAHITIWQNNGENNE